MKPVWTASDLGLGEMQWMAVSKVLREHPRVERAWVFGSRANGHHREGSDLDIAVSGESLSFDDVLRLMLAFEDCWLPFRVDVVWLQEGTNDSFRNAVTESGKEVPLLCNVA